MTPREIVLEQIKHHPTNPVPYSLGFEGGVAERLTEHYGGDSWKERLVPYIVKCCGIDRRKQEPVDEGRARDPFGSIWRTDRRPFHLEEPGLPSPSFDGYDFPAADAFVDPDMRQNALKSLKELSGSFTTIGVGWGLWETCWGIRGFSNALMDCVAEPDFFGELLDRLTDLYLEQLELCTDIPADAFMFGDDWGDKITFWGCLGSQSTISFGSPEEIRAEVRCLRREMGKGGGYILAPAKPLQPGPPTENAVAAVEAFTAASE